MNELNETTPQSIQIVMVYYHLYHLSTTHLGFAHSHVIIVIHFNANWIYFTNEHVFSN